MCFSPHLGIECGGGGGGGGGSPEGWVKNLLVQFFTLSSSKMQVSDEVGLVHNLPI